MIKKILIITFLIFSIALKNEAKHFVDVPHGYWDFQAIDRMSDEGIIQEVSTDRFFPERFITRTEYAKGIIKAIKKEDIPVENAYTFDDINVKHPNWKYVVRALDLEIMKPAMEGYFYPDDFVTRVEMLTFLVNILKSENITKKAALAALQNTYLDYDDIPDWFKVTAGKAEILGVVAKEPPKEHYLNYDGYVTRAQFAFFMDKLKEITQGYLEEQRLKEITPKITEEEGIIIENTQKEGDIVTIKEKTMLPVIILNQLKSGKTQSGTMFNARFADNITDEEKHLLLSKDVILIGKVLNSEKQIPFIRNGNLLLEFSAANKDGNLTRIQGILESEPSDTASNILLKYASPIIKGQELKINDSQILYIRLFKQMRINIVTGDILD